MFVTQLGSEADLRLDTHLSIRRDKDLEFADEPKVIWKFRDLSLQCQTGHLLFHRLEVFLALELVDPSDGRLAAIDRLDHDDPVTGDFNARLEATTSHVIGVEAEAASTEFQIAQHVCGRPFVIVIEDFAGVATRSTVVETQQAEYVNECEGIDLHVILGHLQFDVYVASEDNRRPRSRPFTGVVRSSSFTVIGKA